MEGIVLGQEEVEGAQELERGVGAEVDDGREGEAEEEVVCSAAGEAAVVKVGHAGEVGLFKEERVEPVDAAFVTVDMIKGQILVSLGMSMTYERDGCSMLLTPCVGTLMLISSC